LQHADKENSHTGEKNDTNTNQNKQLVIDYNANYVNDEKNKNSNCIPNKTSKDNSLSDVDQLKNSNQELCRDFSRVNEAMSRLLDKYY